LPTVESRRIHSPAVNDQGQGNRAVDMLAGPWT
jgi:hypothetical protein